MNKKDPYKELSNGLNETDSKVDKLTDRVDTLSHRVDKLLNKLDEFKNKVYELFDKVMGELKAIREEQTIIVGYKDQIEDHETRIGKLEEVLSPHPTS
jgi:uncharacterized coiled-coil DUF342 family protein